MGVRPAFYLDSEYFVTTSGSGSQSSPYIGSAPNKQEDDYTISEPAEDANPDWNVSTEQSIQLTLGPWYSNDGKYSNPTIPVYTIQKTRSDTENMVVVVLRRGDTQKSQQGKFINDVKRLWQDAMKYERIAVMPTDSMFTLFAQLPNRLLTMVEAPSLML